MDTFRNYASRQYLDAKIRTWIDFLRESIAHALSADEAAFGTTLVKIQIVGLS